MEGLERCGTYTYASPGLRATITVYARSVEECRDVHGIAGLAGSDPGSALEAARRLAGLHGGCVYRLEPGVIRVQTRDGAVVVEARLEGPLAAPILALLASRLSSECTPG